jgi:hypothetical protein
MSLRFSSLFCLLLLLIGCSDSKERLKGDRVVLLESHTVLTPDPDAATFNVELTEPILNSDWSQLDFSASHLIPHLQLGDMKTVLWKQSVGSGTGSSGFLLSPPVIQSNVIYSLDAYGLVRAREAKTGKKIWDYDLGSFMSREGLLGGGISVDQGRVFVSFSSADVIALNADDGTLLWRTNVIHSIRSAPTVRDNRVYVITKNNKIIALNTATGEKIWQKEGSAESCCLLGGGAPAVDRRIVIAPFSSGEVYAMKGENGHPLWIESLTALKTFSSISMMSQIKASPVMDGNIVFVVSQSDRMMALDFKTGTVLWEKNIGSISTPVVCGNFIFLLSTNHEAVCLTKETGQVVWVTELPKYKTPDDKSDFIKWHGPILADGKLILSGSNSQALVLDAVTGKTLSEVSLPAPTFLPPIVANRTIYFLTEGGTLVAME